MKFWEILQMVVDDFWGGGIFHTVYIHAYKQEFSFSHIILSLLTIVLVLLLHCFHPETSFLVNL